LISENLPPLGIGAPDLESLRVSTAFDIPRLVV
jgi:hypothetical protein